MLSGTGNQEFPASEGPVRINAAGTIFQKRTGNVGSKIVAIQLPLLIAREHLPILQATQQTNIRKPLTSPIKTLENRSHTPRRHPLHQGSQSVSLRRTDGNHLPAARIASLTTRHFRRTRLLRNVHHRISQPLQNRQKQTPRTRLLRHFNSSLHLIPINRKFQMQSLRHKKSVAYRTRQV